ncbi:heparan-alpha-glucosaminide N-acetyltransferase [Methylocystis sp. IM3]|uniref:heparan-alpha-glucosaminide N-acetyltransferase n=2 Tax=Methylocystis TaxID=133 RepID=UPI00311A91C2
MTARWGALDAARGLAVVAMVAFHLIWDLAHFGYIERTIPWSAPVKAFGHSIAFAFLFIAGVSLVLAHRKGIRWGSFWRRFGIVAGAAALVSVGTWIVFPSAFVFFGILHCIAAASLLSAPFLLLPWPAALAAGALFLAAPHVAASPVFNSSWLQWLGLGTVEPLTQDWRPLFPWAGAMLLGVGAARAFALPQGGAGVKGLDSLGRHSLLIYLLHQPLLFGLFTALIAVAPPADDMRDFVAQCVSGCVAEGSERGFCRKACACTAEEAQRDKAFAGARDDAERGRRLQEIAAGCVGN